MRAAALWLQYFCENMRSCSADNANNKENPLRYKANIAVLSGMLLLLGCSERAAIEREAQGRITAELAARTDISATDREQAAAAIASDLVEAASKGAALQRQLDTENAALDAKLGGVAGAKTQECERLLLEIATLRGQPASADLPAAIKASESRLAELCQAGQ